MNNEDLIEIADSEGLGSGYIIRGYCSVNVDHNGDDFSVMCTKDKAYIEMGGDPNDCNLAHKTTKLKCEHWNKVTPIKL